MNATDALHMHRHSFPPQVCGGKAEPNPGWISLVASGEAIEFTHTPTKVLGSL
jgi:hypothetical protein